MFEYDITSRTTTIEITFKDGPKVKMHSPYAGARKTYKIQKLIIWYVDDRPARWRADGIMIVRATGRPSATGRTLELRSYDEFPADVKAAFDRIARIENPRTLDLDEI